MNAHDRRQLVQEEPPMLNSDKTLLPCPGCGRTPGVSLDGHYVRGWRAQVACPDWNCAVQGPARQTGGFSSDEAKIEAEAIDAWNKMASNGSDGDS